jgi:hypothetical protein
MAEPENHTLHLLREIRGAIGALESRIASMDNKIDRNHEKLQQRIDGIRQAMLGESVLGRYATAELRLSNTVLQCSKAGIDLRRLSSAPH